jgi:putative transposase
VKYAWIHARRRDLPLEVLCETLKVSLSGYRAWLGGGRPGGSERLKKAQAVLVIRSVYEELKGMYGSRRIHQELKRRGYCIGLRRVEGLMSEGQLHGRQKRRYKATTDSRHSLPVAANLVNRNFTAPAPNRVWTSDLTYIGTAEGWLYLAVVLDLFNREVIGWSLQSRMTAEIVTDALSMAWSQRKPATGVIFHSDRGSQYASAATRLKLDSYGMVQSMSRKGDCWDNAPTESFFNTLKTERVYRTRYLTRADAGKDLFEYIEIFYNRKRLHSSLRYLPPVSFREEWIRQQEDQKEVA